MLADLFSGSMYTLGEDTLHVEMALLDPDITPPPEKKIKLAVLEMKSMGVDNHVSQLLTEKMRSDLFASGKFIVMNREDMNRVMQEQEFQNSENCDTEDCILEMGKILGVSKVISGSIGKLGKTYALTTKQINVLTSKNEKIINISKKCSEDYLLTLIEQASRELSSLVR